MGEHLKLTHETQMNLISKRTAGDVQKKEITRYLVSFTDTRFTLPR